MGKATIIEHIGDNDPEKIGLYRVTYHYSRESFDKRLESINTNTESINTQIANETDTYKISLLSLKSKSLSLSHSFLNSAIAADPQVELWCADFTWDLAEIPEGETENKIVGTLEVFGEVGKSRRNKEYEGIVQIAPAYNNAADYLESVFGRLIPAIAQNPYQYFYNTAMLPGHQRWRPLYRYGKITKINSSKTRATVEVEKAYSLTGKGTKNVLERALAAKGKTIDDMPGLNINYEKDVEDREPYHVAKRTNILNPDYEMEIEDVPFSYMSCDGKAFEKDDVVLIKFRDSWDKTKQIGWGNPQIIGFKKQPKPCPFVFYCQNGTDNSLWGMSASWKWVKVAASPIAPVAEGQPGGFWNSLGWDGDNYFIMTYDPLRVWKLGQHGVGGWTEVNISGEIILYQYNIFFIL